MSKLENFSEQISQLASDLVFCDLNSMEEFSAFKVQLASVQKSCSTKEFKGLDRLIVQGLNVVEIPDFPQDKRGNVFNALVSTLQYATEDLIGKHDIQHHFVGFDQILSEYISSEDDAPIERGLSQSQVEEIPDYVTSAMDLVDQIEHELLELEKWADDDIINTLFRHFHTLKGESNLLGIINIGGLAHKGETLLGKLRAKELEVEEDILHTLFNVTDIFKNTLRLLADDVMKGINEDLSSAVQLIDLTIQRKEQEQVKKALQAAKESLPEQIDVTYRIEFLAKIPELDLKNNGQMLNGFITRSQEYLLEIENLLTHISSHINDKESKEKVFRLFHTVKGLAYFLDLQDIEILAYESECFFRLIANQIIPSEKFYFDMGFKSIEYMRSLILLLQEQIDNNGKIVSEYLNVADHVEALRRLNVENEAKKKPIGEILIHDGAITDDELDLALGFQEESPSKKIGDILVDAKAASKKQIDRALALQDGKRADASIRIQTDKLDFLIDLVGELVINETQVVHSPVVQCADNQRFTKDIQQLQYITRRLQEIAMGMRLVQINPIFQKMVRLIRDTSKQSHKDVKVVLSGQDTEIDRTMVDLIGDPLMHMIRNAVDHGIESREDRIAKGKDPVGTIELKALHRGGNVVVEIVDDGGGLNKDRILQKAIEKGIVKGNEKLSDQRIYSLIFEPGFTTRDEVTDLSGRGVGMDVVKKNIEQMRGKIDIQSEEGKGTKFSIQLPITLAIIEGILFRIGVHRYILPINSVIEFLQPDPNKLNVISGKAQMYRVHDEVYPLMYLNKYFGVDSEHLRFEDGTICLIESEYGRICVMVDELLGQQQVVIKSLSESLGSIGGVSGAAILGDGRVGLILDPNGLVTLSREKVVYEEVVSYG